MRSYIQFAAACLLLACPATRADFIVVSRTTLLPTGRFAGEQQITFLVQNNGQGVTAGTSRLLALDVTMKAFLFNPNFPDGHLFIHAFDEEGSGKMDDADFAGVGGGTPALSYIRAGSPFEFAVVSTSPPFHSPDDPATVTNRTPYSDGQSVPQFEVSGAPGLAAGGIDARQPIPFAVAVVPPCESVELTGTLGAESGGPLPFNVFTPLTPICPDPAMSAVVAGLAGLIPRRRQC